MRIDLFRLSNINFIELFATVCMDSHLNLTAFTSIFYDKDIDPMFEIILCVVMVPECLRAAWKL